MQVGQNGADRPPGLLETRTREWLLLLEFRKRETFAYSCEAYGWIVEHAKTKAERLTMGQEFAGQAHRFAGDGMDAVELTSIVGEACEARNGWKVILGRCAAAKVTQREILARLTQAAGGDQAKTTLTGCRHRHHVPGVPKTDDIRASSKARRQPGGNQ